MHVWPIEAVHTTAEVFAGFFLFEAMLIGVPMALAVVVYHGYFKKMLAGKLKELNLK